MTTKTTPSKVDKNHHRIGRFVRSSFCLFGGAGGGTLLLLMLLFSMHSCFMGLFVRFLFHSMMIWNVYFMGIYGFAYFILYRRIHADYPTKLARIQKLLTIPSSPSKKTTAAAGHHHQQQEKTLCWVRLLADDEEDEEIENLLAFQYSSSSEEDDDDEEEEDAAAALFSTNAESDDAPFKAAENPLVIQKEEEEEEEEEEENLAAEFIGSEKREQEDLSSNNNDNNNIRPCVVVIVSEEEGEEEEKVGDCLVVHLEDGDPTKPFHMSYQKQCQHRMQKSILKSSLYLVGSLLALYLLYGGVRGLLPIILIASTNSQEEDLQNNKMNEDDDDDDSSSIYTTIMGVLGVGNDNDNHHDNHEYCRIPPLLAVAYDILILLQILIMILAPLQFYNNKTRKNRTNQEDMELGGTSYRD